MHSILWLQSMVVINLIRTAMPIRTYVRITWRIVGVVHGYCEAVGISSSSTYKQDVRGNLQWLILSRVGTHSDHTGELTVYYYRTPKSSRMPDPKMPNFRSIYPHKIYPLFSSILRPEAWALSGSPLASYPYYYGSGLKKLRHVLFFFSALRATTFLRF